MVMTLLWAQPQTFTYQALVRDPGGEAMTDQVVSFRIGILQDSVTGTAVYREDHLATTNSFGLVILEIGKGSPVSGSFTDIH